MIHNISKFVLLPMNTLLASIILLSVFTLYTFSCSCSAFNQANTASFITQRNRYAPATGSTFLSTRDVSDEIHHISSEHHHPHLHQDFVSSSSRRPFSISSPLFHSKLYYSNDDGSLSEQLLEMYTDRSPIKDLPFLNNNYFDSDIVPLTDFLHTDDDADEEHDNEMEFISTMLRASAHQLSSHQKSYVVYHIPGDLVNNSEEFNTLMNDIAISRQLGVSPIIVAGCNDKTNSILDQTRCHVHSLSTEDGEEIIDCLEGGMKECDSTIPVTDYDTLNSIKAEIGMIRFELEHQLAHAFRTHRLNMNDDAFTMSNDDHDKDEEDDYSSHEEEEEGGNIISGNFYSAVPYGVIDGIDFQYTGYPRRFQVDKIKQILDSNDVVLLSSLGSTPTGQTYNVNSKHLAKCLGEELDATEVVYCSKNKEESSSSNSYSQQLRVRGLTII